MLNTPPGSGTPFDRLLEISRDLPTIVNELESASPGQHRTNDSPAEKAADRRSVRADFAAEQLETARGRAQPWGRGQRRSQPHPATYWLVVDVVNKRDTPAPIKQDAEQLLSGASHGWPEVASVAQVRDPDLTHPPDYPEWLITLQGECRRGDLVRPSGWNTAARRRVAERGKSRIAHRVAVATQVERCGAIAS